MWRHFAEISKRIKQVACQISVVLFLLVVLVGQNGREAVEAEVHADLVDLVGKVAGWRCALDRNVDDLRREWLWNWRGNAGCAAVSPTALVDHFGLFVGRLGERFDSGHGVLGIEVVNRRFYNSRRHEHNILLALPLNLRVLFVMLPHLVHLLWVLHDHDDPLIIQMIGRGRRCDPGRYAEPIDLHELLK